ncbi:MAG: hypothetical protein KKD98_02740, partial [Candidatus Thermoplasmatota archaeon]|nr:hypothetical protein [Candidatus Thermoplasmatota archaeon]
HQRTREEFLSILGGEISKIILDKVMDGSKLDALVARILKREIDPYKAACDCIREFSENR